MKRGTRKKKFCLISFLSDIKLENILWGRLTWDWSRLGWNYAREMKKETEKKLGSVGQGVRWV